MSQHDPIRWMAENLDVGPTTYGAFFYGQIEQWSPGRLPGINCAFHPTDRAHFAARVDLLTSKFPNLGRNTSPPVSEALLALGKPVVASFVAPDREDFPPSLRTSPLTPIPPPSWE